MAAIYGIDNIRACAAPGVFFGFGPRGGVCCRFEYYFYLTGGSEGVEVGSVSAARVLAVTVEPAS